MSFDSGVTTTADKMWNAFPPHKVPDPPLHSVPPPPCMRWDTLSDFHHQRFVFTVLELYISGILRCILSCVSYKVSEVHAPHSICHWGVYVFNWVAFLCMNALPDSYPPPAHEHFQLEATMSKTTTNACVHVFM